MDEQNKSKNDVERQLAYYKKQLDRISGEGIRNDYLQSSLQHELKQTKDALAILISLQQEFSETVPIDTIFYKTARTITTRLRMDHAIVLTPQQNTNTFKPVISFGFPEDEEALIHQTHIELPIQFLAADQYILHNKSTPVNDLTARLQESFPINFFVGVPVLIDLKAVAFIIADRQMEKIPFFLPLNNVDAQTLIAVAGLISSILQSRNLIEIKLQKTEIEKQKEKITKQRDILEKTISELRNTQAQLIQKEKMASLGELTAGIAHEIQNPLNFVNNLSDVNTELIDEAIQEIRKGNINAANFILQDIQVNEQKISQHGKRADAIVKGMLQHSRSSSGVKEPTDINALADEYLKLAYHGLRAKDKSFNTAIKTNFDNSIAKVNIVSQDMGRVLLNLINNAFYSVSEKQKYHLPNFEPVVVVTTMGFADNVELSVIDNGTGIPTHVLDKIFQPFFTTRPTGQGTGLGLSLSYDIVKVHGGEITVETTEGEGSKFKVIIPR
jgi:signal transduction histidine kinase